MSHLYSQVDRDAEEKFIAQEIGEDEKYDRSNRVGDIEAETARQLQGSNAY